MLISFAKNLVQIACALLMQLNSLCDKTQNLLLFVGTLILFCNFSANGKNTDISYHYEADLTSVLKLHNLF